MTGFAPGIPKEDLLEVPFLECFFHTSPLWRFEDNRKVIVTLAFTSQRAVRSTLPRQ